MLLVRRTRPPLIATGIGVLPALCCCRCRSTGWSGTIDLHETWWQTVTETTAPNLLNPDNVSLASMYAKWLGIGSRRPRSRRHPHSFCWLAWRWCFFGGTPSGAPEGLEGSLLLLLIPLLSPQGWDYVLLIATPAIIYLANYWRPYRVPCGP